MLKLYRCIAAAALSLACLAPLCFTAAPAAAQEYVSTWIPVVWDSAGSRTVHLAGTTDTVRTASVSTKHWLWNSSAAITSQTLGSFVVTGAPGTASGASGADSIYFAIEGSWDGGQTWVTHYGSMLQGLGTLGVGNCAAAGGIAGTTSAPRVYVGRLFSDADTQTGGFPLNLWGATNVRAKVIASGAAIVGARAYFVPLIRPGYASN